MRVQVTQCGMVTDPWVLSDALSGVGPEKVELIQSKGQGLRKQATVGLAPGLPFLSGKVPLCSF